MTQEEMRNEFYALYNMMANSDKVEFMHTFGQVHKEMMEWFIDNKPAEAQGWIEKLESIRWKNYLTSKEALRVVEKMSPEAPWSFEQWKAAMGKSGFELSKEPCYNSFALWVVMNMIMSDSSETLEKYIDGDKIFEIVHSLAIDKLQDEDERFNVRRYFGL